MTFLRIVITLYLFDLSMISAQTRSAFVARENRRLLFRILYDNFLPPQRPINARKGALSGDGTMLQHPRCGWQRRDLRCRRLSE
jgi:hypothetical protein